MGHKNLDVQGEKYVRNDAEELSLHDRAKEAAWNEHYKSPLKVKFKWNPYSLTEVYPTERWPHISLDLVIKGIKQRKWAWLIVGGAHDLMEDTIYFGKICT